MDNSRRIIGVHGLKNKPKPTNLTKLWKQAIADGLKRNRNRSITYNSLPFEHAYWADVHHTKPTADRQYQPGKGRSPYPEYRESLLDSARAFISDIADNPVDWAKQWMKMTRLADKFLAEVFEDLARYYARDDYRAEVRQRLRERILKHALDGDNPHKRIMVIAHSMGSIVAYDVLRDLGRDHPGIRINHFITIGSPLGLPHVKHRIEEEHGKARTPTNVLRWTNMAERYDPVAADTHLETDYGPNDDGLRVRDDLVLNDQVMNAKGDTDYHASVGYLRTPEMSQLIDAFL